MEFTVRSYKRRLYDKIKKKCVWRKKFVFLPKTVSNENGLCRIVMFRTVYVKHSLSLKNNVWLSGMSFRFTPKYKLPDDLTYETLENANQEDKIHFESYQVEDIHFESYRVEDEFRDLENSLKIKK